MRDQQKNWVGFGAAHWLSWIIGVALLSALLLIVAQFSEEEEFLTLASHIRPWSLFLAALLQAATYLTQGEIWRTIAGASNLKLSIWTAYKLSLAKLFVDQALPSSGLSGTIVVSKALEEQGMPQSKVFASALINTSSFCASYAIGLLAMMLIQGTRINKVIAVVSVLFILLGFALTALIPWLAGKKLSAVFFKKFGPVKNVMSFLEEADPELARNPWIQTRSTLLQIITLLLDSTTLWVLIGSVGGNVSPANVFAGFMFASLVRSAGIIPGGLGTFESACVWTLSSAGISASVSLAGTLLFRGLSFWIPMLPGFWLSRRVIRKDRPGRLNS